MWYYSNNDQQEGPVDAEVLHDLYQRGLLDRTALVWREGMSDWVSYAAAFPERVQVPPMIDPGHAPHSSVPASPPAPLDQAFELNPYQAPQHGGPTQPGSRTSMSLPGSGLATASMTTGILSFVLGILCCSPLGIVGGVLAIVLSQLAKNEAARAAALPAGMQVMSQSVQDRIKFGRIAGIVALATSSLALLATIWFKFINVI